MISEGRAIPSVDTLVMRPAGMDTGQNSIFEEYLAGGLHRLVGGDFDSFMVFFCRLFPLLTIPILFLWMSGTGFSWSESMYASAIYAVFLPALLRFRGESLYRETVALPLIFAALMLADLAVRSKDARVIYRSVAGSVFFLAALASWKVTGFLSFFLFLWFAFSKTDWSVVVPFATMQIAASLLLPHMRHDLAILSPATFMALFSVLASATGKRSLAWIGAFLSATSVFLVSRGSSAHVAAVILAKLRFLFAHPEDPLQLSKDARLFWVSGYENPSPGQVVLLFGAAITLAAAGWKRFSRLAGRSLLFWVLPLSLAGYLFFERLHTLLALAIIPAAVSTCRNSRWALTAVILLLGTLSMVAPSTAALLSRTGLGLSDSSSLLGDAELDDLLEWSRDNPGTVLSFWHISGLLSAYSGTPVVTHTFFENAENRETIVQFAEKIFLSENEMAVFMEEKEAEYLVYQADFIYDRSPAGLAYLAGLTQIPDGSLAVRLHYYPQSLERLALVWQGPSLRVFQLDGEPESQLARYALWEREYGPFISQHEAALSTVVYPVDTGIRLAETGMSMGDPDRVSAALLLFAGNSETVPPEAVTELLQFLLMEYLDGRYTLDRLALDFESYLESWGPDPAVRVDLVRLLMEGGMEDRAAHHMEILENDRTGGS